MVGRNIKEMHLNILGVLVRLFIDSNDQLKMY